MNTTLEQRLALYERALKAVSIREDIYMNGWEYDSGICKLLTKVNNRFFNLEKFFPYNVEHYCPEIYKFKPDNASEWWFPHGEWEERIKILEKAIAYSKELIAQQVK